MVQRPGGADFAPGAYVFPGGTVHQDDRSFPDELRAAAVRELFEEAGILLATDAREADAERVRPPTMSRLLAAMEDEGLVRRAPHATDGRSVRIHATAKGRRLIERGREQRLGLLEDLLRDADAREVAVLREAAEIVERALRSA